MFLATSFPSATPGMKKLIRIQVALSCSGIEMFLMVEMWKGTERPLMGRRIASFSMSTFN